MMVRVTGHERSTHATKGINTATRVGHRAAASVGRIGHRAAARVERIAAVRSTQSVGPQNAFAGAALAARLFHCHGAVAAWT